MAQNGLSDIFMSYQQAPREKNGFTDGTDKMRVTFIFIFQKQMKLISNQVQPL